MGFSESFVSMEQSRSDPKRGLSSLVNSHIENVSSRLSKGTSSQVTSDASMLVAASYFESTSSAIQPCENHQSTTIRDHFRIEEDCPEMVFRRRACLEKLLGILYEDCRRRISTDVDLTTDSSHLSDSSQRISSALTEQQLQKLDCDSLKERIQQMYCDVEYANMKLLKVLKQRAHQLARQAARCNIITAVLQAMSEKRRIDTKLQFSLDPPGNESGFEEWLNAMKAVARLPDGIPSYFRRKLWVILANYHIDRLDLNWEQTRRVAFNERINPDDDRLSFQIIKDLHRTGWSGISGEAERIHLKRVLLGYARFNKTIGYCQGFNVIAALVLEVTEFKEECALKVMIFLIEQVLPQGYFDQSLRALSVDMAVLRSLLHQRLPKTARHLDELQRSSECENEPPLTNVFSMHWFLTLFATCLPKSCVYRLWDALMLEGSEVLLRASLAIWAKFSKRILSTASTDHFYTLMGTLCEKLTQMRQMDINNFMSIVYTMSEFPYPGIAELRNRFTWNVESHPSALTQFQKQLTSMLHFADDDASDSEYTSCVNCSSDEKSLPTTRASDMAALQKRYKLLRQRQKQAAIIIQASYQQSRDCIINVAERSYKTNDGQHSADLDDTSATMFNHLYVGALLAGFGKYNTQLQPPTYNTMNGTVAVTSTIVQPVNTDTLKTAIDFSGNGQVQSGPSDILARYQQKSGSTEVGLISVDRRILSTDTMTSQETTPPPAISRSKEANRSLADTDYDDDEVFLTQFIKINDNLSLPRSNGQRKESAPACMLTVIAGDSETRKEGTPRRSASCAADYDSCQTQRELLEERSTTEERIFDSPTERRCAIVDPINLDSQADLCNSIPLNLKVFVANGNGPYIHSKRSIARIKNTNANSALVAQNGAGGASRKQTMTRRSLAVLEKLSKQPTTVRNLPHNPFPVIHKSFQEDCSEALYQ